MSSDMWLGAVALMVIFVLEGLFPYKPRQTGRLKHGGHHLVLAGVNAVINAGFALLHVGVAAWTGRHVFGLLYFFGQEGWLRLAVGLILFDIWMYVWHRLNHEIGLFWRFHIVHHTDIQMDSTTALRFHPIEMVFSSGLNLLIVLLLGMQVKELIIYKALLLPVILFHHSNVYLPDRLDAGLRRLAVSPNMHRVHHSYHHFETNSNYGSVFTLWDRIFRTYREHPDPRAIRFGLEVMREPGWQTLGGMLKTPFAATPEGMSYAQSARSDHLRARTREG